MDLIQILNGTLVIHRLDRWLKDEDGDWVGFSSPEHVATFSGLTILITATNGPLVYVLLKQATKTFIDWLIITDCILCIPNIVVMTLMSALKFVMLKEIQVCHFSPITPIAYYLGMEDNRQDGDDRHCIICINKHILKCKERRLGSMLGLVLKC